MKNRQTLNEYQSSILYGYIISLIYGISITFRQTNKQASKRSHTPKRTDGTRISMSFDSLLVAPPRRNKEENKINYKRRHTLGGCNLNKQALYLCVCLRVFLSIFSWHTIYTESELFFYIREKE